MEHEWRRGAYAISTDRNRLDFDFLQAFLTNTYWSPGISREVIERAADHALVFGLYHGTDDGAIQRQVGYARVLTDQVAMAYLLDVFVSEPHRRQGLAQWLMETILAHPDLQDVREWQLKTRDAHRLYEKVGFAPPPHLERFMERRGGGA